LPIKHTCNSREISSNEKTRNRGELVAFIAGQNVLCIEVILLTVVLNLLLSPRCNNSLCWHIQTREDATEISKLDAVMLVERKQNSALSTKSLDFW